MMRRRTGMKGTAVTTIGLIGAGHIESQIARLVVANGYDVVISNSRGPKALSALVAELGPRARTAKAVNGKQASVPHDQRSMRGYFLQVPAEGQAIRVQYADSLEGKLRARFSRKAIRPLPKDRQG
jgi:3-hydroxyacyl-CoA dehydrogenase